MYSPSSNLPYGVIGNCQVLALVSECSSIDWLCFPRFDSPSVFAKLLDEKKGGNFSIQPESENYKCKQSYIRNTNILVTRFEAQDGIFEVHDFSPRFSLQDRYYKAPAVYRIIRVIEGSPRVVVICDPKLNYAQEQPEIKIGSNHINYSNELRLSTTVPLTYILERKAFKVNHDQYFVLTWGEPLEANLKFTSEEFYERTKYYWELWIKRSNIGHLYQDACIRAALALKLHYFQDTGAFIAAATTSIPEADGSGRNWDYRFCWLRDAYFTILALDSIGHFEEKEQFVKYLSDIIYSDLNLKMNQNGALQPVYGISGEKDLIESELTHLAGFKGNKPVRIGNAAYTHKQFDVYGEMVLCLTPIFFDRRLISYDLKALFEDFKLLVEKSIELFCKSDAGIWEFRSEESIYTFSQVFCWVALDRGVKVARHMQETTLADQWQRKANEMQEIILKHSWNEEEQMFTQKFHGQNADASNLLMAQLGIIDSKDPRFISTVKRYGEILRKDDHIFRYVTKDDFGLPESSFTICTFWYISALISIGETNEAKRLYENLIKQANHLGLLSEDLDPINSALWGNFPQTYSLVGIIIVAKQLGALTDSNSLWNSNI